MAVTAEVCTHTFDEQMTSESWQSLVMSLPETAYERAPRMRAAQFIGSIATQAETSGRHESEAGEYSLMHALHEAASGSTEARAMARQNVATDMVERTLKSGHVIRVDLSIDDNGNVLQHGQSAIEIQRNSLRYASRNPEMRCRTEAEARNMFRIEEAYRQGLLHDYAFVVFSRAADDMEERKMAEAGFFTDTMSCAIQVTSLNQGKLSVESAFVAGKTTWNAPRHDAATLARLGGMLDVDIAGKSATELLDTPLLVHKSLLENGVVDIVQWYDHAAGGTFFGESKTQQDYIAYLQHCKDREASYAARVEAVVDRLIAEAHDFKTPQAASQRLAKLSEAAMLEQSITDISIDPRVFGIAAAYRIDHARSLTVEGRFSEAQFKIDEAKRLARSSSCPSGAGGTVEGADDGQQGGSTGEDLGDCEFVSKECPKCHKKNVKTVMKKGRYHGDCGCKS